MTRVEALSLIPPGWVECSDKQWSSSGCPNWRMRYGVPYEEVVYAIPVPKPEPRRVPVGEGFTLHVDASTLSSQPSWIPMRLLDAAVWRLDLDTREWVEVLE